LSEEKVVFTDVKPGNLYLLGDRICLSDVKSILQMDYKMGSPDDELPLLTPEFRPPESYSRGRRVNYDLFLGTLYSLGITFLQLLTGSVELRQLDDSHNIDDPIGKALERYIRLLVSPKPSDRLGALKLRKDSNSH